MGACVSSRSTKTAKFRGREGGAAASSSIKPPLTAKVVHVDGRVQELKQTIPARNITAQNPNCFICSSESMSIGTCVPHVPDEEELQPGQIYFLLPRSQSHKSLSLPDLCALAIKASSGLAKEGIDLSSSNSNLIFR